MVDYLSFGLSKIHADVSDVPDAEVKERLIQVSFYTQSLYHPSIYRYIKSCMQHISTGHTVTRPRKGSAEFATALRITDLNDDVLLQKETNI